MTTYQVKWGIEVEANSPEEAADKALEIDVKNRPDLVATAKPVDDEEWDRARKSVCILKAIQQTEKQDHWFREKIGKSAYSALTLEEKDQLAAENVVNAAILYKDGDLRQRTLKAIEIDAMRCIVEEHKTWQKAAEKILSLL